jgi:hypothetical protein
MSCRARAFWPWLALLFLVGPFAGAQEEGPKQPEPPQPKQVREQTIYIPYEKLKGVFEKEGRGVFVPYEKFQELWAAARKAVREPEPNRPPVDAILTEIESEASVSKDVLVVKAKLAIELLKEGWLEIPLRLNDAAIRSAKIGEENARILRKEDGSHALLVEKKGKESARIELALEYAKAITKSPGSNRVAVAAPQAPVNRWRIRIPEPGVKVNVQPMLAGAEGAADGEKKNDKETVILAFVGAAPEVQIQWTPKAEGAAGLKALVNVQTRQEVTLEEGVTRTHATLTYDIQRAELTELRIEVPVEHKVVNVFDANVRQWKVEKGEEETQTITVQLFEPTRGTQSLVLDLEKFDNDEMRKNAATLVMRAPQIKALDVDRQQGFLVVQLASTLRGEVTERSGLTQLGESELPAPLAGKNWAFAFRFVTLPYELAITTEVLQPLIEAQELAEAFLEPEQLTLGLLAMFDVQRAGVFQLEFDIPPDFEVRQVTGRQLGEYAPAQVDAYQVVGEKKDKLQVKLARKALGKIGLAVELERRLNVPELLTPSEKPATIDLPLPRINASSVARTSGKLIVCAHEGLRVEPEKQEGARPVALSEARASGLSLRDGRFPQCRDTLAFAFQQQATNLSLAVSRRKAQITVGQLLTAKVEGGVVKYDAQFFYNILYSGVKSLRIDIPAELAQGSRLRNLTQQRYPDRPLMPVPADVPAGYHARQITGDGELLGDIQVHFSWEEPLKELQVGSERKIVVPRLIPQDVDRAWGQIAIVKDENIDIGLAGSPKNLRPIDPQADLQLGQVPNASRAWEFHDDWSLTLAATRYELEEVKRTSIDRALVRMVVTRGNELAVQALYRVRTARQRLAVQLPAAASSQTSFDLNPARINGQAAPLEKDNTQLYVPIVGFTPETPFLLELRYTLPGNQADLELPTFPEDPAVQKVYLAAYLPQEQQVLGVSGPWTDEQTAESLGGYAGQRPPKSDQELLNWVREGIANCGEPGQSFSVDGKLWLFSAIRPEPGAKGALRLISIHRYALQAIVLIGVAVAGLALAFRSVGERLLGALALVIFLVLIAVFAPALAAAINDWPIYTAAGVVLLAWAGQGAVWCSQKCFTWCCQPRMAPAPSEGGTPFAPTEATTEDKGRLVLTTAAPPPLDTGGASANPPPPPSGGTELEKKDDKPEQGGAHE